MNYGSDEHQIARRLAAAFARRLREMAEDETPNRALVFLEIADLIEADEAREREMTVGPPAGRWGVVDGPALLGAERYARYVGLAERGRRGEWSSRRKNWRKPGHLRKS